MSVSNDQSPPARKVVPYKKGGRRQSPFSGMSFQFSGTALDVAIQQRAQESEESLPGVSPPELPAAESTLPDAQSFRGASPEAQADPQNIVTSANSSPDPAIEGEATPSPPPPVFKRPEIIKKQPSRSPRTPPATRGRSPDYAGARPDLQIFIDRWKPFLTDTQISICAYIHNNSTATGQEYCFTSTAKLMAVVSKTERQVKTVLNQLLEWQFLVKGNTVFNAPREKRGTFYKLNLDKT